jgi:amidase
MARISEVNDNLKAVISVSPTALEAAKRLDVERSQGKVRSLLHGIPIAIKDNIATDPSDGMPTTAGSFALLDATVAGDADAVARLREAGAIMLCESMQI